MRRDGQVLAAKGGFFSETYREHGLAACLRKIAAAVHMNLPLLLRGRRTNASVGAYFDLITDDARMFYGDSFHFGYFKRGDEGFAEALDAHTDVVAEMACLAPGHRVLDIGCGIGAPAIRIARREKCHITGINISAEQVRQGRSLVEQEGLSDRIALSEGNALELDFEDASFDAILCVEVAGDICVTPEQKQRLIGEMHRVLKPGGRIGFSDLVFTGRPSADEERAMRAILYHEGAELITDWPDYFTRGGFRVMEQRDIIAQTMQTWAHSLAVYEQQEEAVIRRYGRRVALRTMEQLRAIPAIIEKYGSFVVLSALKPFSPPRAA